MKILRSAILGTLIVGVIFAIGCVWYYGSIIPPERLPRLLSSSVSPDQKWLCEILDIHPNPCVTLVLVHAGPYLGHIPMDRGYYGESFVSDLDSSGLPGDLSYKWDGPTVSVINLEQNPVVLKCAKRGTTVSTATAER